MHELQTQPVCLSTAANFPVTFWCTEKVSRQEIKCLRVINRSLKVLELHGKRITRGETQAL